MVRGFLGATRLLLVVLTAAAVVDAIHVPSGNVKSIYPQCTPAFASPDITAPYAATLCNSPERSSVPLSVTGTVPQWLRGSTFYRNMPAAFQFGSDQVRHWFDAFGQVAAIDFEADGSATLRAKFINTTSFHTANATQSYPFIGLGTSPSPGAMDFSKNPEHLQHDSRRHDGDSSKKSAQRNQKKMKETPKRNVGGMGTNVAVNTDVNFMAFAGKLFAVTDQDIFIEIDPKTLETKTPGGYHWNDTLTSWMDGHATTQAMAHGTFDSQSGEYFNYAADTIPTIMPGGQATFRFYRLRESAAELESAWTREVLAEVKLPKAKYSHSLGLSKHYVVWMELPIAINDWGVVFNEPILKSFEDLSKSEPTRFHVIDRANGTHRVVNAPLDFGCAFHTGNVYEDPTDGSIVYYASRTHNCMYFEKLMIDTMLTEPEVLLESSTGFRLARCRISVTTWTATCEDVVPDFQAGFPWYNKQFHQRPNRWGYASNWLDNSTSEGSVAKIDLVNDAVAAQYRVPHALMHEAIFVPSSQRFDLAPEQEDDGLLMTIQTHLLTNVTSIVALDGKTFSPVFSVEMPFALPWHFHGILCQPNTLNKDKQFCVWN